jgi:hypothetical protein
VPSNMITTRAINYHNLIYLPIMLTYCVIMEF